MKPITLYPRRRNLVAGLIVSLICLAYGFFFWGQSNDPMAEDPELSLVVGGMLALLGAKILLDITLRLIWERPVFAADEDGFSVMNKAKKPWSAFQDITFHRQKFFFAIPGPGWLTIRVGKTRLLARRRRINWFHLPGGLDNVAEVINAYAARAKAVGLARQHMADEMRLAKNVKSSVEAAPVSGVRNGRAAMPAKTPAADRGPIQEVRGFGDRLFGSKARSQNQY